MEIAGKVTVGMNMIVERKLKKPKRTVILSIWTTTIKTLSTPTEKEKQNFNDRRPDNYKAKEKETKKIPQDAVEAAIMANRRPNYKTEKTSQEIENDVDKFLSKMVMAAKDYEAVQNNEQAVRQAKC